MKRKTKVLWSLLGWAVLCLVLLSIKCDAQARGMSGLAHRCATGMIEPGDNATVYPEGIFGKLLRDLDSVCAKEQAALDQYRRDRRAEIWRLFGPDSTAAPGPGLAETRLVMPLRVDSMFVSIFDQPVDTIRVTCPLCGDCVPTLLWKGDIWTWCCRNTGDRFEKTFRPKDKIVWGKMVRR